jgi:hypothetical protein
LRKYKEYILLIYQLDKEYLLLLLIINSCTMEVKEKFKEYLVFKGISPTSAERKLGWGVNAFTKAKSISVDRAKEFLLLFKDLSAEWLLRDEGDMIKGNGNDEGQKKPSIDENFYKRIIEEQLDTIGMLKRRVAELEAKGNEDSEQSISV